MADKIAEQDRAEIKNQIVQLMITVPEKLQLQISDALALIAASDFPEKWDNLLPVSVDISSAENVYSHNSTKNRNSLVN